MMIDAAIERYKAQHQQRSAELDELRRYAQHLQKELLRLEGGLAALQQLKREEGGGEEDAAPIDERSDADQPAATFA